MVKKIIVGIIVLVGIAVIILVGLNLVNKTVEKEIKHSFDEKIEEMELTDTLTYDDISIDSSKGILTVNGLSMADDEYELELDSLKINIPVSDALGLVQDSTNATIKEFEVSISGLELTNVLNDMTIIEDEVYMHFKGEFKTSMFLNDDSLEVEDFTISFIEMDNRNIKISLPTGDLNFGSLSFYIDCDITAKDLASDSSNNDYWFFKDLINEVSLNFEGFKYEPGEELKQNIEIMINMILGEVSFIGNLDNWAVDKLSIYLKEENNLVLLEQCNVITNWIDFDLNGSSGLEDGMDSITPLKLHLNMNDYTNELRPFFEMFVYKIADETLPEGEFSLDIFLADDTTIPEIVVGSIN